MAITVSAAPLDIQLSIAMKDYRGQVANERVLLANDTTDVQVAAIVQSYDNVSNAGFTDVELVTRRKITGYKAAAIATNFERNISEVMALSFLGTNPVNTLKRLARTFKIYAMSGAIEDVNGYPNVDNLLVSGNVDLIALLTVLNAQHAVVGSNGTVYKGGLFYNHDESHHITEEDVVDNI